MTAAKRERLLSGKSGPTAAFVLDPAQRTAPKVTVQQLLAMRCQHLPGSPATLECTGMPKTGSGRQKKLDLPSIGTITV